jgi:hypothetical protein
VRIRSSLLCILLSAFAAPACLADWLVLQGGKQMETKGQWVIAGNLLSFRTADGTPKRVLLSVVDYDATLKANPRAAKARDSEWHVSAQGIKMLQETARQQQAMEARMRAQQEMSAQMGSVAAKPGAAGGSPGSPQGQGKSQANGQYGGYATRGLQGIAACKVYQDNPSLYSSCLSQY